MGFKSPTRYCLEATTTTGIPTSLSHPIPLFHSTPTHLAARCLASSVANACSTDVSSADGSRSSVFVPAGIVSHTEGASFHSSPHSVAFLTAFPPLSSRLVFHPASPALPPPLSSHLVFHTAPRAHPLSSHLFHRRPLVPPEVAQVSFVSSALART